MNKTIATLTNVKGEIVLDFTQSGDQYLVITHDAEAREHKHKEFQTKAEAYTAYEQITKSVILDDCSFEQRKAMLD